MRAKRTILFRIGAILLLLIIAGIMMVIGRGHTVYIDNKSIDYNGQTYTTPYKVVVYVDGEQVAKLRDKERGMATCIGQTFKMTLEITQEKGGSEEMVDVTVSLPHQMCIRDRAYLSEFQVAPEVVEEESESSSDEIPVDGIPAEGIPSDI